uniref:JmjC domain-containing protein n=1 Tax=Chenopodium quinoa TaxID=63459 RepID=A0A803L2S6_CHEQI
MCPLCQKNDKQGVVRCTKCKTKLCCIPQDGEEEEEVEGVEEEDEEDEEEEGIEEEEKEEEEDEEDEEEEVDEDKQEEEEEEEVDEGEEEEAEVDEGEDEEEVEEGEEEEEEHENIQGKEIEERTLSMQGRKKRGMGKKPEDNIAEVNVEECSGGNDENIDNHINCEGELAEDIMENEERCDINDDKSGRCNLRKIKGHKMCNKHLIPIREKKLKPQPMYDENGIKIDSSMCHQCQRNDKGRVVSKAVRIGQSFNILRTVLPFLKQFNQEQMIEKEAEAKIQGFVKFISDPMGYLMEVDGTPVSEVLVQSAIQNLKAKFCNNCRASIADFHRSCPEYAYNLCISCCLEIRSGKLQGCEEVIVEYINRGFQYLHGISSSRGASEGVDALAAKRLPRKIKTDVKSVKTNLGKEAPTQSMRIAGTNFLEPQPEKYKGNLDCKADENGSICCHSLEHGGCRVMLELYSILSDGWVSDLVKEAEEVVAKWGNKYSSQTPSECSCSDPICDVDCGSKKQKCASRECSTDNHLYLYCPDAKDIQHGDLQHFQCHWARGEPIIVTNLWSSILFMIRHFTLLRSIKGAEGRIWQGIEAWTYVQNLGEAVFIPAGCPHQVRNLKSCIKVALDFVSPESVGECIRLAGELSEFCLKTTRPKWISWQYVKRMNLYAVKKAISSLKFEEEIDLSDIDNESEPELFPE